MLAVMPTTTCLLFFPGSKRELFPKAIATAAWQVCADLEDSVTPEEKSSARASVLELLAEEADCARLVVRINHPSTADGVRDLEALAGLGRRPSRLTVMLPKIDASTQVDEVRAFLAADLGEVSFIPIVETARGLARVEEIAAARDVSALLFGSLDLSVALGCAREWEALLYARSRCVLAARLAGVGLVDAPYFDVGDADGLRFEAGRARRLGFTGKAAIHPSQVAVIDSVFAPTEDEVERARRIVSVFEREGRGAFLLDGVMIDRPVVEAARRVLGRSLEEE